MIRILSLVSDVTELAETAAALAKAKEDAEAASFAKSQFLAAMSHEIRTPMNAIVGMAELLGGTPLNQEQRQYLHIFQAASESLLTLLGDILDISKVEAGQCQLERIPFSLPSIVDTVCKVLGPRAGEKGLELSVSYAPGVPTVLVGDPTRLRQVLINLVGNAIKFTHKGEVNIELQAASGAATNDAYSLHCSVRDTGIGIKPENLSSIFERFTQADSSITREYGGSGLGLTICKSLVEFMGGRLWVESVEGEGSTFHFTALLGYPSSLDEVQAAIAAAEDGPSAILSDQGGAADTTEEPLQILLVEDSDYNAYVVLAYLKDLNCDIDIAKNGLEGFDFFKSKSYHLVLMDMRMPLMDGYTASKAIRQWEREQGAAPVPIVAMTAQAFMEDRQRSLDAGCDMHLAKPIHKKALLEAIAKMAPTPPDISEPRQFPQFAMNEHASSNLASPLETAYPPFGPILVEVDPDFREIAPRYLESLSHAVSVMREAVDKGDTLPLERYGHQMKGEGKAFGLEPVSEMGLTLQLAGESADLEMGARVLDSLEDYLKRITIKSS